MPPPLRCVRRRRGPLPRHPPPLGGCPPEHQQMVRSQCTRCPRTWNIPAPFLGLSTVPRQPPLYACYFRNCAARGLGNIGRPDSESDHESPCTNSIRRCTAYTVETSCQRHNSMDVRAGSGYASTIRDMKKLYAPCCVLCSHDGGSIPRPQVGTRYTATHYNGSEG